MGPRPEAPDDGTNDVEREIYLSLLTDADDVDVCHIVPLPQRDNDWTTEWVAASGDAFVELDRSL